MFFILDSFWKNDGLLTIRGGETLIAILHFRCDRHWYFLCHPAVLHQQFSDEAAEKKEIGLYNILGMEKKNSHI